MGNRVTIQRTIFSDLSRDPESYGYRIFDDYDQDYLNTLTPDVLQLESLEFLHYIVKNGFTSNNTDELISFAMEHGMYIDDDWFEADEITKCVNGAQDEYIGSVH